MTYDPRSNEVIDTKNDVRFGKYLSSNPILGNCQCIFLRFARLLLAVLLKGYAV